MKPKNITKSGAIKPRYSNYYGPYMIGVPSAADVGLPGGNSSTSSGSGLFDITSSVNNIVSVLGNVATSIWGRSDQYRAQALATINDQQRKTTTVLWVVVILMAVAGIIVLVKKSK